MHACMMDKKGPASNCAYNTIIASFCTIKPSRTNPKRTADPKAPLPQAVLHFCTKKIAGMLIHFVKQQVIHTSTSRVDVFVLLYWHPSTTHARARISSQPLLTTPKIHKHTHKARRMNQDPVRDPLAVQVRRRRPFYEEYLLPRIRQFCEAKGACAADGA